MSEIGPRDRLVDKPADKPVDIGQQSPSVIAYIDYQPLAIP